jgi:hypothetical protein
VLLPFSCTYVPAAEPFGARRAVQSELAESSSWSLSVESPRSSDLSGLRVRDCRGVLRPRRESRFALPTELIDLKDRAGDQVYSFR